MLLYVVKRLFFYLYFILSFPAKFDSFETVSIKRYAFLKVATDFSMFFSMFFYVRKLFLIKRSVLKFNFSG